MNLLGINTSWQYVVQGIVILIAVFVDYLKNSASGTSFLHRMGLVKKSK